MTTAPCWAQVRGPLAPYAEGFRAELERLGYTPLTAAGHLRLVAHLSRWMLGQNLTLAALTQATVDAYFAERRALGYVNSVTGRSLRPLLDYLRCLGVAPPVAPAVPTTPVEVLLVQYRDYLSVERGLAATTVELNVRLVRPLSTYPCEWLRQEFRRRRSGRGSGYRDAGQRASSPRVTTNCSSCYRT
jgi:hypothetical protein